MYVRGPVFTCGDAEEGVEGHGKRLEARPVFLAAASTANPSLPLCVALGALLREQIDGDDGVDGDGDDEEKEGV